MTQTDFSRDLEIATALADAAGAAIRPHFRSGLSVDNKLEAGFDPVTAADKASEQAMRAILEAQAADDGIFGEEFGRTPSRNGREWVLDPIDGTRAFISGLPCWTVLIALAVEGVPQLGVIDQPHTGERFIGLPGESWLDHAGARSALKTRDTASLAEATLATTDPFLFKGEEYRAFSAVSDACQLVRFGYDAYAYAMIAAGGVDLVVESGLQAYDVNALIPVVTGAGGVVTDWRGGSAAGGGQVIAAANADLHAQALALLESAAV
ncbi:histidinol-phosphatase [Maricaulis sp.]|uniref:histidinol-phosphatase n=1 Tax=Maricaulis sp. TaxID=1486257 RepID=UPI00261A82DC|nr:histidinol-phosphatase [Maricaulis sp.]